MAAWAGLPCPPLEELSRRNRKTSFRHEISAALPELGRGRFCATPISERLQGGQEVAVANVEPTGALATGDHAGYHLVADVWPASQVLNR